MKFIFPQNYDFKNKLFGVIDYTTAFVNLLWCALVLFLIHLFFKSLMVKIFLFILLCLPLFLFSFSGFQGENIIYVFSYLIHFIFKQKLFLYKKRS